MAQLPKAIDAITLFQKALQQKIAVVPGPGDRKSRWPSWAASRAGWRPVVDTMGASPPQGDKPAVVPRGPVPVNSSSL